jgi:methylmalonyl-CoA/ethylmalonyl-CoA epimerase
MENNSKIEAVHQIGIVVKDIDGTIKSWEKLFNIGPWRSIIWDGKDDVGNVFKVRLAFADVGPVQIELIQTLEGRSFYSSFIEKNGEGLHHLGVRVDNVDSQAANLVKQGAKILNSRSGSFAYMDTQGPGGVMWEFIRSPNKV